MISGREYIQEQSAGRIIRFQNGTSFQQSLIGSMMLFQLSGNWNKIVQY